MKTSQQSVGTDHLAVVLGLFETGLAVARSLARSGVRVEAVHHRADWARWSRSVKRFALCPHPLDHEERFITFLVERFTESDRRPVLFVTADEYVTMVSKHRDRLESAFNVIQPPREIVEAVEDKFRQYELALASGVPVPATFAPDSGDEVRELSNHLVFPVLVKGRHASQWRRVHGGAHKVEVVHSAPSLIELVREILRQGLKPIVQEIVSGPDTDHFKVCVYVNRDGRLTHSFLLRKLRQYPPGFGTGCAVESVIADDVLDVGTAFFDAIGYRGVGSAEFKRDGTSGEWKLIELNPRYWQQCGLATACGVDFPLVQYTDLTRQIPLECRMTRSSYETGVTWVSLAADARSFRELNRSGRLGLLEWLGTLHGRRVFSDLSLKDPLPFAARVIQALASRPGTRASKGAKNNARAAP